MSLLTVTAAQRQTLRDKATTLATGTGTTATMVVVAGVLTGVTLA